MVYAVLYLCICVKELRCKLARLRVQVEELQTERQERLQYKNEGSIKDYQKIEKLEKHIASTQINFQELSGAFSILCFNFTAIITQISIMLSYKISTVIIIIIYYRSK